MHRILVTRAPEKMMLGHGDKQSAARLSCIEHLYQYILILNNVFQDIECSHDVKFALKWNASCIHLIQLHIWQTCFGNGKAVRKNFAARQAHSRKLFMNPCKNETSSATNLEETFGVRKIIAERPLNELIPRSRPKICFFNSGKPGEIFGFESRSGVERVLGELTYSVAQDWPIPTSRTSPIVAFKATYAREAP